MKNEYKYKFKLYNPEAPGVPYDEFYTNNLREGKSDAAHRGPTIVIVYKNGEKFLEYRTR